MAHVLKLLGEDCSIDTIINERILPETETYIRAYQNGALVEGDTSKFVGLLKFYCPEFGNLIVASSELSPEKKPSNDII